MGPLHGLRVLEFEAIGPVPWAAMMLADMGADVLRIARPVPADMGITRDARHETVLRGRRSLTANLKDAAARDAVLALAQNAHVVLEGNRPGVMERLGLGPDACLAASPSLVYGRMTGWGQQGPLAQTVGHDINYLGLTGALHAIGTAERPVVPLNLIGDFGGGAMLLALGVMAAVLEARTSGKGQVVDAAMVDGSLLLMAPILGRVATGEWLDRRESNLLDGGAPFYGVYETRDGRHVAVGAIEPAFYAALLAGLGLAADALPPQHDRAAWPETRRCFTALFATRTRDAWCAVFDGTEACVTPVLSLAEVPGHAHHVARESFVQVGGVRQPAPAPRFSRTASVTGRTPAEAREGGGEALRDWGFDPADACWSALGRR
ncbi:CaiB/BaiF CoA transferase family protein [Variovorax sp. GB1P17]|uniref:CaiB/BaiF CoA transferase family protein n=1 Tax=Variovorax sp. GB1P17 TaxID=3443740 RepID=UPI003F483394